MVLLILVNARGYPKNIEGIQSLIFPFSLVSYSSKQWIRMSFEAYLQQVMPYMLSVFCIDGTHKCLWKNCNIKTAIAQEKLPTNGA
jgi:hypothetical protein